MTVILGAVLTAAVFVSTAAAQKTTVYNNFGPGHEGWDYNWGLGWTVAGPNVPSQYGVEQAMGFTSTADGVVSDIWVAMWYVPLDPQPDEVTVKLARNPNGQPPRPEDVMEEWVITEFEPWTHWSPPRHLVGSGVSNLEEGADYWLWAEGGDTTWCGWCLNIDPHLTCPHTLRREGEPWLPIGNETASAFRVDVFDEVILCEMVKKAKFKCNAGKLRIKVRFRDDRYDGRIITVGYTTGSTRITINGRKAKDKVKRLVGSILVSLDDPDCPEFDKELNCD